MFNTTMPGDSILNKPLKTLHPKIGQVMTLHHRLIKIVLQQVILEGGPEKFEILSLK